MTALAIACGGDPAPSGTVIGHLDGPAGDLASEHVPDVPVAPASADDFQWFETPTGPIGLSRTEIVVALADGVTVREANALFESLSARIVGAEPESTFLLLRLPDAPDVGLVLAVRDRLLADPRVAAAIVEDAVMTLESLPPNATDARVLRPERGLNWVWSTRIDSSGGNWGLEAARFPQVWNLSDYLAGNVTLPEIGVLEGGFASHHPDHLGFVPETNSEDVLSAAGRSNRDHGTMVLGILRAARGDERGVAGALALPVTVHARAHLGPDTLLATSIRAPERLRWPVGRTFRRLIDVIEAGARIVNNSYGFGGEYCYDPAACVDPMRASPPWERSLTWARYVELQANLHQVFLDRLARSGGGKRFLLVASAGNCGIRTDARCANLPAGFEFRARDNSPIANLAARDPGPSGSPGYVSVGATQPAATATGFALTDFSTRQATVAAPGRYIRSTEADEAAELPGATAVSDDRDGDDGDPLYATNEGTSFAAPLATALATYVWSLDPEREPTDVRRLLIDTVDATGQIDAFAAMLAADSEGAAPSLVVALADLDDGLAAFGGSVDGNLRWRITDPGCETHDPAAAPRCEVTTAPSPRGDIVIDIRDFRVLRDAMVQVAPGFGRPENLDGGPDNPLTDLNEDRCVTPATGPSRPVAGRTTVCADAAVGSAPAESVYPRADLNGDGTLSVDATAPFLGVDLTDLDVMMSVWPTGDGAVTLGYDDSDLPRLLDSGDIHLDFGALPLDADAVDLEVTGLPRPLSVTDLARGATVVTVPAGGAIEVTAHAIAGGVRIACLRTTVPLARGQDVVARPDTSCTTPRFWIERPFAPSLPMCATTRADDYDVEMTCPEPPEAPWICPLVDSEDNPPGCGAPWGEIAAGAAFPATSTAGNSTASATVELSGGPVAGGADFTVRLSGQATVGGDVGADERGQYGAGFGFVVRSDLDAASLSRDWRMRVTCSGGATVSSLASSYSWASISGFGLTGCDATTLSSAALGFTLTPTENVVGFPGPMGRNFDFVAEGGAAHYAGDAGGLSNASSLDVSVRIVVERIPP